MVRPADGQLCHHLTHDLLRGAALLIVDLKGANLCKGRPHANKKKQNKKEEEKEEERKMKKNDENDENDDEEEEERKKGKI